MITAEDFFRNKLRELQPNREVITLANEMITAEQGMRWANEFKQLHLHNVSDMLLQKEAIDFVMWCKNNGEFVYQYECNRHYNEILYTKFKSNYR